MGIFLLSVTILLKKCDIEKKIRSFPSLYVATQSQEIGKGNIERKILILCTFGCQM